jgi:hypothetical protein
MAQALFNEIDDSYRPQQATAGGTRQEHKP